MLIVRLFNIADEPLGAYSVHEFEDIKPEHKRTCALLIAAKDKYGNARLPGLGRLFTQGANTVFNLPTDDVEAYGQPHSEGGG